MATIMTLVLGGEQIVCPIKIHTRSYTIAAKGNQMKRLAWLGRSGLQGFAPGISQKGAEALSFLFRLMAQALSEFIVKYDRSSHIS